jgi:phage gp46-like protein
VGRGREGWEFDAGEQGKLGICIWTLNLAKAVKDVYILAQF